MTKNIKILLAEDDTNLGNLLCDYLKAKGFHTVLAANGEEAFNLFVKGSYNLCLLDVMMPIKHAARFLNGAAFKPIPAIMVRASDAFARKLIEYDLLGVNVNTWLKLTDQGSPAAATSAK